MGFRINENGIFRGTVQFLNAILQAGAVVKGMIAAAAGIEASKLQHQHRAGVAQESGTTASDEIHIVHVAHGLTGKLLAIKAGCVVACTGTDVIDVDLLKNGATVLAAKIRIDNGDAAYALVEGTINAGADELLEAGDVLEVDIDVTAGDGALGKGCFAYVDLEEDYD